MLSLYVAPSRQYNSKVILSKNDFVLEDGLLMFNNIFFLNNK